MTEQHPLTDEMCFQLSGLDSSYPDYCVEWHREDMRDAADWQLEQVIKWLEDYPWSDVIIYNGEDALIEEFKKAMRPQQQQQQENN